MGGRCRGHAATGGGDSGSATGGAKGPRRRIPPPADESTAAATGRRVEAALRGWRGAGGMMTGRANGTAEQAGRRRDGGPLQMDDDG